MDRFSKLNPKVTLLFFLFVTVTALTVFNPIYLAVCLVSGFLYKLILDGVSAFSYLFKFILPMILLVSVFNMLFSHMGMTVLFSVNDVNFTLESLFYGFTQSLTFCSIIVWFSCYNSIVSSQMLLSVFGKAMPNVSLVFTMVLSFIPRMKRNIKEINEARTQLNNDKSKLKVAVESFSTLVTMTLEESIELSKSMKARGFSSDRTVYTKYKFSLRDLVVLLIELSLTVTVIIYKAVGKTKILIDPEIKLEDFSIVAFTCYTVLMLLPVIINVKEDIKWHYLKQKI